MSVDEARELYGLLGSLAVAMEEDRYAGADIVRRAASRIWGQRDLPVACDACGLIGLHDEECSTGIARRAKPWDPDNPGCAPEECGGSRLDPCADSFKTEGRTHDILGDEMKAAGLDPDNLTLRHAVREEGGVAHYLVALEIAEHEAKQAPEREVPVSQLVTGDSVYSPSTKTWHEVRRATSGQLYFQRDGAWTPVNFAADVKFLTRRGDAGAAAVLMFDAFGGEVIEG